MYASAARSDASQTDIMPNLAVLPLSPIGYGGLPCRFEFRLTIVLSKEITIFLAQFIALTRVRSSYTIRQMYAFCRRK